MKRILFLASVALVALSCGGNQPAELYVPKNTVEFAGNAFQAFSLGADVKLYTSPKPGDNSKWTIQAVVPVRKETNAAIGDLFIDVVPLDDRGIRIRDGFALLGEDLQDLVPVYNSASGVERTVVFTLPDEYPDKYLSAKQANELLMKTKGVRMAFNVPEATPAAPLVTKDAAPKTEEYPMTLDGQLRKYGIYGKLGQYESALKRGDKKGAKKIEDNLWTIEKQFKNNNAIPEWLRKAFVDYIEDKEDEIEKRN